MDDRFPLDENGDALRNMVESGDDLSKEREIDFSILFPTKANAVRFSEAVSKYGWKISHYANELGEWDVTVSLNMLPTHALITDMESLLAQLAAPMRGKNDGWGCFAVQIMN